MQGRQEIQDEQCEEEDVDKSYDPFYHRSYILIVLIPIFCDTKGCHDATTISEKFCLRKLAPPTDDEGNFHNYEGQFNPEGCSKYWIFVKRIRETPILRTDKDGSDYVSNTAGMLSYDRMSLRVCRAHKHYQQCIMSMRILTCIKDGEKDETGTPYKGGEDGADREAPVGPVLIVC